MNHEKLEKANELKAEIDVMQKEICNIDNLLETYKDAGITIRENSYDKIHFSNYKNSKNLTKNKIYSDGFEAFLLISKAKFEKELSKLQQEFVEL